MGRDHFDYIDSLKGIAIILVVVGHCIAWNYSDFNTTILESKPSDMFWWHLIYSFHMPLFFWISGFLLPRKTINLDVLWRRTYTLLIPFICAGIIMDFLSNGGDCPKTLI